MKRLLPALAGVVLSALAGTLLLLVLGESPEVLFDAFHAVLFTPFGLGYTLFYTTPLIFTGLAVAVAFQTGLLNIGGEGQLYFGALAIALLAALFPQCPGWLAVPLGILVAALAGAVWGALAGLLKAWRGSHEVIVTILLNFIGLAIVDYCILYPLRAQDSQNPETALLPSAFTVPPLSAIGLPALEATPVNVSLFMAIALAVAAHIFLFHTRWGLELRTVGQSPTAARFAGMSPGKNIFWAMALSGGLAGLVGVNEMMGHHHRLIQGFSPGYGFTGVAVALLARNQPLGILFSALLFGSLHNSARELEFLSEKVTKELSLVLQGVLIAFVGCEALWSRLWRRKAAL